MQTKWRVPMVALGMLTVCCLSARAGGGDSVSFPEITAQVSLSQERLKLSPYILNITLINHTQETIEGKLEPCPLVYFIQRQGKTIYTYPMKKPLQRPTTCTAELIEVSLPPGKAIMVYTQPSYSAGDKPGRVPSGTYQIM